MVFIFSFQIFHNPNFTAYLGLAYMPICDPTTPNLNLGFVIQLSTASSSNGSVGVSGKGTSGGNTKGRAAPKAKPGAKSSDPVFVALTWRRKTMRDYNQLISSFPSAIRIGKSAIDEACHTYTDIYVHTHTHIVVVRKIMM